MLPSQVLYRFFRGFQMSGAQSCLKQGRPKAPLVMQSALHKSSVGGGREKNRSWETKFKFGQVILKLIIKIVATSCHILRLKCTKFSDRTRRARRTPREPLAGFKGSCF